MKISIVWLRRDLRLEDNTAVTEALRSGLPVLLVFIFDQNILHGLPADDARVGFIHTSLETIQNKLAAKGSSLLSIKGDPVKVWEDLIAKYDIANVFINKDYEPYALQRDTGVKTLLEKKGIQVHFFKDQVIFEENEIVKDDGMPYTIFTPYKNKWLKYFDRKQIDNSTTIKTGIFYKSKFRMPKLSEIGFQRSSITVRDVDLSQIDQYADKRDFPAFETSRLGPHLRFGTVNVRQIISQLRDSDEVFLSELIWREFFMQILFHFPHVTTHNFKRQYDGIVWRNNEKEFEAWCQGKTGYPLVDAGMRQLMATGFMHNRVRMVTASFLCKHLLIDWKWGEAYFAEKLLDYELASNNGNWQWAAGTGCDAAPYFRIFNPTEQLKKFDKDLTYVKKWVPEFGSSGYPEPMIKHEVARERALRTYRNGLRNIP